MSNPPGSWTDRDKSWGQDYSFSWMDRFGIWLSVRQIQRRVGSFRDKVVADVGCGFNAVFMRSKLDEVARATLVDVRIADDLKAHPKVTAIEGLLPSALDGAAAGSHDIVIANNVLEHLWDPVAVVAHVRRMLKPGGISIINVPSWRGKLVLETGAFRLGTTSRDEIDDHKRYYDERELWSLVVRGGFKPSEVRCFSHKFGLNTCAVCAVR